MANTYLTYNPFGGSGGGGGGGVTSINSLTGPIVLVPGTNITFTTVGNDITINSTGGGGGSGTVTSVSVVSANGLSGSVSNPTTTPAITLSPSFTGIAYSNGSALAAAVAGNFPTLNQSTTGTAANITATSNSSLTTLSALSLPYSQVTGAPAAFTFADSIINSSGTVTLVNDAATPGASEYYGTNASSVKGYYSLPSSGALTIGTIDGNGASANGLSIASSVLYAQSASATVPGMINTTTQQLAGAKTLNGAVGGNPSTILLDPNFGGGSGSGVVLKGNNVSSSLLFSAWNTSTGGEAGIIFGNDQGQDVGNIVLIGSAGIGALAGGTMRIANGASGPLLIQSNGGGGIITGTSNPVNSPLTIEPNGQLLIYGSSQTGANMIIDPGSPASTIKYLNNVNALPQLTFQNNNAGSAAGVQMNLYSDSAAFFFYASPSGATPSGLNLASQATFLGDGVGGTLINNVGGGDVVIAQAGVSKIRLRANGNTSVPLSTYASDTAAGTAGLVTGDLYINSSISGAANVVCSKI